MIVKVKQLHPDAIVPIYKSELAAGFDLAAYLEEPITINPNEIKLIKTGIAVELPKGYEMQIRPRSGLALKHGITVLNSPGTIDADYRGEIGVILINLGSESYTIRHGDRIAQGVVKKVKTVWFKVVEELSKTNRGESGFGSTGS